MQIEELQQICKSLKAVTEDIKWENHLCFCVGEKMFVIVGLDQHPTSASFKTTDESFIELCQREGIVPAPYMARNKWVHVDDINRLSAGEWEHYAATAYQLIKSKLTKKLQKELGI